MAANGLRPTVAALLAAAEKGGGEEDAARWIDAGKCWVWYGAKREAPWSRYRFNYEGPCRNGRAEGSGRLDVKVNPNGDGAKNGAKNFEPRPEITASWRSGVPLADKPGSRPDIATGLSDRAVLSWVGSTQNEEAEIFAVSKADDQGQVSACQAQAALAVTAQPPSNEAQLKILLRRSALVLNAFCPERAAALWTVTLAPAEGLAFYGRQGGATVQPILARAEIREGVIFDFKAGVAEPLPLLPSAQPVAGAEPLVWTQTQGGGPLQSLALPGGLALLLLLGLGAAFINMLRASRGITPAKRPAKKR
jgi:hypothetical protein